MSVDESPRTARHVGVESVAPGSVGVYDSGVGGVSVLRALRRRLPGAAFVYVADSGYAPYGDRDPAWVRARAQAVGDFLVARGARALVLACNTASVVAASALRERLTVPIVAMEPAIKPAATHTRSGVVLVLATRTTVHSESVARLVREHGQGAEILLQPCPGLVERIERGALDDAGTQAMLADYLGPGLARGADTIVLGCTHYPFVAPAIARLAGPGVRIIEPSDAVAAQLARRLAPQPGPPAACTTFFTSGSTRALVAFLAAAGWPEHDARVLPAAI